LKKAVYDIKKESHNGKDITWPKSKKRRPNKYSHHSKGIGIPLFASPKGNAQKHWQIINREIIYGL